MLSCHVAACIDGHGSSKFLNPTQPLLTQPIRDYRYTQFCYESKTQVIVNYVCCNEQTIRQFQRIVREYYETTILILKSPVLSTQSIVTAPLLHGRK